MTNLRFAGEISRLLVYAPLRGLRRPAIGAGMYFSVSHRSSIQHGRTTALASSLVALPASLGLLRAVSRTARALRAPLRFACAVFRACALRVLGTSALRAFTFLQAFASTVRNRRSASLASSLAALVAHWAHFGLFPPQAAASVRPAKNARNDVHAVISDLNLVLPILCQCSEIRLTTLGASRICV